MSRSTLAGGQEAALAVGSEELEALRESVEKVLASECDSRALHAFIDGESRLDRNLWLHAADLAWTAVALPERWGGLGLGALGSYVLHCELGRRAVPGPYIATLSVAQWLSEIGAEEHQQQFLPPIVSGKLTAAVPARIGDGVSLTLRDSRLHGEMDLLGCVDAGLILLPVRAEDGTDAWALLQPDGKSASLQRRNFWDRTREVCRLQCNGARLASLRADADGSLGRRLQRHLALATAADSLGGAAQIANQTVEYLKSRVQFERPIASFQAIKHRAANMTVDIATQRYILEQAVECASQDSPDAEMWAALAKVGATRMFAAVAGDCIQLHGGVGHTWEFDPHIYAKRARLNEAVISDNGALLDFSARALAGATQLGRITTELSL